MVLFAAPCLAAAAARLPELGCSSNSSSGTCCSNGHSSSSNCLTDPSWDAAEKEELQCQPHVHFFVLTANIEPYGLALNPCRQMPNPSQTLCRTPHSYPLQLASRASPADGLGSYTRNPYRRLHERVCWALCVSYQLCSACVQRVDAAARYAHPRSA